VLQSIFQKKVNNIKNRRNNFANYKKSDCLEEILLVRKVSIALLINITYGKYSNRNLKKILNHIEGSV
jgi:hypothetical protein